MIIYKATNKINGKCYIGQTKYSLGKRINKHFSYVRNNSKTYIHNALRKYGQENFIWEVIEECDTLDELDEMEFHYIKQYKSYWKENGYNLTYGGDGVCLYGDRNGMYNKKHSNESIKKMSKNRKGLAVGDKNPSSAGAGVYELTLPYGKKIVIKNIRKYCRENKLNNTPFYGMCNGKRKKKYKGYWCERLEYSHQRKKELGI